MFFFYATIAHNILLHRKLCMYLTLILLKKKMEKKLYSLCTKKFVIFRINVLINIILYRTIAVQTIYIYLRYFYIWRIPYEKSGKNFEKKILSKI